MVASQLQDLAAIARMGRSPHAWLCDLEQGLIADVADDDPSGAVSLGKPVALNRRLRFPAERLAPG